jgi:16S rRNA (adenine1518-N6/adenine1519-N6)-dimethyltransferase
MSGSSARPGHSRIPRLSQHFLHDPRILDRIVDALDPRPDDVVLEIGAGRGTLTRRLAGRVAAVVAIEKDRDLVAELKRGRGAVGGRMGEAVGSLPRNVVVVGADALELDWHEALHGAPLPPAVPKIVGNIPYAITTPLIDKALTPPLPERIVFLVQKEVADRLAAGAGSKTYGALSVGVQSVARVERLFTVRAGAFRPPPQVDSAVIRLTPLEEPLVPPARQAAFRRFVTALFGQRRKQLSRSLRSIAGLDRDAAERLLARQGHAPTARPETLTPEALARLHDALLPP